MICVEAPAQKIPPDKTMLFLGGGISNCPNWQKEMLELLEDQDIVVFNPRRENFDMKEKGIAKQQIKWEFDRLELADLVCFWFPAETLCPITLFELGKLIVSAIPVFVGTHPQYQRKLDVEVQTKLSRPQRGKIASSVKELSLQIKKFLKKK